VDRYEERAVRRGEDPGPRLNALIAEVADM
jgi:hypothetical protein